MIYKKIFAFLMVFCLMATAVSFPANSLSEEEITAPSAILMEPASKEILYEQNSHEQRACASVTKIMTLLLVMEALDSGKITLDETVTASAKAASMGGSDIWLEEGEQMSVDDLIKATAVASANDAAVALAEHICGDLGEFIAQMNNKAKELGMNDTTFKNCNGLDEEGHVTSAYDVALMSAALMEHPKIFDYTSIWMDNLRGGETQIVNTNKLLKTYNGITGLKTGTTDDAGCCMSASACRDDLNLVAVVLGCKTGTQRFKEAAALLDYGFANYKYTNLSVPEDFPQEIEVVGGMIPQTSLSCNVSQGALLPKSQSAEIKREIDLPESVEAPVESGQTIGTLIYSCADKELGRFDITANEDIASIGFSPVLSLIYNALIAL